MATKTKTSNTLSTYKTTSGNTVANKNTMTTSQIKSMQTALQKAGYNIGSTGADGVWGAKTEAALSKWKSDNGVSNNAGSTIGQSNYNKLIGYTPTTTTTTSSGGKSNTSSGTNSNYLVTAGQTGNYADITNKAQAYLTGGTYTPNQAIDTNYWGAQGGKAAMYNNDKTYKGLAMTADDIAKASYYASLYDQQQGYNNAKEDTTAMIEAELAPYLQYLQNAQTDSSAALQNSNAASKTAINAAYDDTARKYYQLYKTQNAKLPENLSLAGVTGGASESAQLNLLNTYANNLYNNESGRNAQLANVDQDYNDKVASNSISAANSIADAYLQLAQQKIAYDREDAQLAAEAQKTAEEQAAAQKLAAYNANVRKRMLDQLNKGDTIWSWTDETGQLHWTTYKATAQAYKSTYKVTELTTKDKDKVSSLGTKNNNNNNDDPFGNNDSGTTEKSAYDKALNTAAAMMSISSVYGPTNAAKFISENTTLTDSEKSKMYKALGLL